jgi:tetratricopeptide (TPR) repeat protein
MGDGVNVAARLMQAAHEGACLASEELKKSASSAYYFQDLPPMQFKGKSRPLPVAKLQGRLGEKFEVPFFIGRERELALLREALQDHPEDRAFLAWVEGEPGIGKSYFLHYFADCSLPPDGRYHSRCQSYAASIAYYPVQKFLADILKDLETGGTVAPREKILEVLARRDPGIGEYAPLLFRLLNLSAPGDEEPDLEPEIRRSVLWKMMLLLLEEAVDRREVGWIIDNAQWMDEESRAFLIHLLRMLESRRLRIFAASREAAPEEPGLDVHRIPIEPFAPQEAAAFACAVLGVRDVPEEALKKAWAVGKGNPLLQLESLKLMLKSGYLSRSEDLPDILMVDPSLETEMPESLAGIVLSQVDALPADEKAALSRLSVVGENIPEILVRALGMDPLVLDRLTASGQFLRYNPASRNFFFAKQAYQQALYESLEFAFRRETHRRIGEAIPQVFDSSRPDYAFLLAGHFGEAEDARAIPFLQRIGREARASYALEEAARAFSRLVRISEKTGGDLQAALVELADLWLLLGNAGEAVKLLEGHFSAFGPEWTSAAHRTLAGALRAQGAFGLAEARGKKALAASANPRDSFLAECFLGKLYGQTGRMEPALRLLEGIDRTHRRFRDDPEYQMNRMRLAFIHFQTGKASRAVKTFQSLNTWFRQHRQIKGQYIILNNMSKLALEQGNYAKAIRYCREAYAIVHKFGVWESETTLSILQNLGVTYLDLGDFKNARKHLSTGLAYARRISSPLEYKALYSLAFVSFDLGNLKECLDLLNNALQACTAAEIPRHEVLELFLDLYLVLAHRPGFEEALRSYRAEVERMNLLYLKASLLNYRAEGAWMFEGSTGLMEPLKANMESCRREGDAVEAYRAARSLFCMTRDPRYLSDLAALSGRFQRRRNRVGFLLLSYQADPTGRNRSRLLAQLRRYPYGVYRLEASVVSAQNAATPRRAALHRREVRRLLEDLARGLPEDLQASFRSRADIRSVLEEASPVPADASSPARK